MSVTKHGGDVTYGNENYAVDYNLCIDNSTSETVFCSAFYRLVNEESVWHHDDCSRYYPYEIDFLDENWREKLKEAAKAAYKALWN